MRQSQMLVPTLKENPADAECASHRYLVRAGFIRQTAAGIYSYLPLGYRVIRKIEAIVRDEMEKAGCVELLMPAMQPAELWHETGRWHVYGPELMRLKDRHGRDFALGATHEELITSLVRDELNSYKKLPMTLYQIQTKYRDERRPRFGLLRGREFIMKDAYSFHSNPESLDERYQIMYEAYKNIFSRCGLDFRPVIADSGAIGGKDTHEFMALAEVGEDTIAYSDSSDYAANIEMAAVLFKEEKSDEALLPLDTGDVKAGEENSIKIGWYRADDTNVCVLYRAGNEINEVKVKNVLDAAMIEEWAHDGDPFEMKDSVVLLADQALKNVVNGRLDNKNGEVLHYNVNVERDLPHARIADLCMIKEGDPSPDGVGTIRFARGIEVGQIFKIGTKYADAMGANFLDENGKSQPIIMGCYGIGISRTLSAIAEQHHDEFGLVWPKSVAPFTVHIVPVNAKNEAQKLLSEQLYEHLSRDYDVLLDDRDERAGVKFAEADLIGCPIRITVGKKAQEGLIELKDRRTGEQRECAVSEVEEAIREFLNK
ncbi:proline--tRNA ligase [Tuberibacillus calidus]|uniref:proline--tRNA ligase n=1 Tax=Tuberibacillus calidus TaxID=340097 RepID=UPI00048442EE|nr:proline--tRNA ligase [Tuberibacillus calidus]